MTFTLNKQTDAYEEVMMEKEGNMSVQYRYHNLASVADFYDNKAAEERAKSKRENSRLKDRKAATERAAVYESVAYMLRNTVLDK